MTLASHFFTINSFRKTILILSCVVLTSLSCASSIKKQNTADKKRDSIIVKRNILPKSQKKLCAKFRKGHFEGVLDIMDKFIKLINPKYIFMGEKDFQQLFLINKFIIKKYNSKVYQCKTIRDKNFVALSTRNYLLNKTNLINVGFIAKNLHKFKQKLKKIKKINKYILNKKRELINKFAIKIEYLEVLNEADLKVYRYKSKFKLFIAYHIGKVRLIDNF